MNAARLIFASALVGLLACSSSSSGPAGTTGGDDTGTTPTDDTGTPADDTAPPDEDTATALTYPDGPYGLKLHNVFPNLTFKGYSDGAIGDFTDHSMLDYYDPDGSRGITAIYFVVAAQWCGPCNEEADHLPVWYTTSYKDRGARFVSAVIESATPKNDATGKQIGWMPATQTTVNSWVKKHKVNFDIMLDDTESALPHTGSVGLPYNYIIDPRNMTVKRILQGIDPATVPCTTDAGCCKTATTPDVCTQDYSCSTTLKTCLTPTMQGPIPGLDALMLTNGAKAFDTGLTP